MTINPYITFDGNCREAFEFYKSVFGGDFMAVRTFADGPDEMPIQEADKSRIMHMSLPVGDTVLMGSDVASGFGDAPKSHDGISLSYIPHSREDADRVFAGLSGNGGTPTLPMEDAFWGSYFGMCQDRFGIKWMINYNTQTV
ncbi:MAG: VOC family protein [Pseudomonadota bacterium]